MIARPALGESVVFFGLPRGLRESLTSCYNFLLAVKIMFFLSFFTKLIFLRSDDTWTTDGLYALCKGIRLNVTRYRKGPQY